VAALSRPSKREAQKEMQNERSCGAKQKRRQCCKVHKAVSVSENGRTGEKKSELLKNKNKVK